MQKIPEEAKLFISWLLFFLDVCYLTNILWFTEMPSSGWRVFAFPLWKEFAVSFVSLEWASFTTGVSGAPGVPWRFTNQRTGIREWMTSMPSTPHNLTFPLVKEKLHQHWKVHLVMVWMELQMLHASLQSPKHLPQQNEHGIVKALFPDSYKGGGIRDGLCWLIMCLNIWIASIG